MRFLAFAALTLSLAGSALAQDVSERDRAHWEGLLGHYTDAEKALAMFSGWEIVNGYCVRVLGDPIYTNKGLTVLMISRLLIKAEDQIEAPGRAGEIYNLMWSEFAPLKDVQNDLPTMKGLCDKYRADVSSWWDAVAKRRNAESGK